MSLVLTGGLAGTSASRGCKVSIVSIFGVSSNHDLDHSWRCSGQPTRAIDNALRQLLSYVYLVVLGLSWPCLVRLCNELKYVSDEQECMNIYIYRCHAMSFQQSFPSSFALCLRSAAEGPHPHHPLAEWHYNLKWTGRRLSVKLFDGR